MATQVSSPQRIAIIGGGVSGALVAANLLRMANAPLWVTVIERLPPLGRGVAYGTDCAEHRLNVPAGRMGAYPEDIEHFYRWVAERVGRVGYPAQVAPTDFLSRRLYGDYIYTVLSAARDGARPDLKFESIVGEAVDIESTDGIHQIILADGRSFAADQVVLAIGNLPGEYPIRRSLRFYHGPRYVHVPWLPGAIDGIGQNRDILIVGAGLTAVDVILQLEAQGHQGKIHALARRGILPQSHRQGLPSHPPIFRGELPATARGALHQVRAAIRENAAQGGDWRVVIDALRGQTQEIWRGWNWEERSRFLRYLRPFWEAYRHRFAPEIADRIARLRETGRLRFYAGRLQTLTETPTGAEAIFRRRGTEELVTLSVAKVINCTGPRSDYTKYQHPLLINLLARGSIDHDFLALGINALPDGRVLKYRAGPNDWLWTIGAPLKGVLWECSAVSEIRDQAKRLAATLISI